MNYQDDTRQNQPLPQTYKTPVHTGKKKKIVLIIVAMIFLSGIVAYFSRFEFIYHTGTYEKSQSLGQKLPASEQYYYFSYDEPGVIYYSMRWKATAKVGTNIENAYYSILYAETRLYKYNFETGKSEFVAVLNAIKPSGQNGWGDPYYIPENYLEKVFSYINKNKIILGRGWPVKESDHEYFEFFLDSRQRQPIFQTLDKQYAIEMVKQLNNGQYFACGRRPSDKDTTGLILNRDGTIIKKLYSDSSCFMTLQRNGSVLMAKDNISDYEIGDDGAIREISPPAPRYVGLSPDGKFGVDFEWTSHKLGEEHPPFFKWRRRNDNGEYLNGRVEQVILDNNYMESIPGQPHFPTKAEAYWMYFKSLFNSK